MVARMLLDVVVDLGVDAEPAVEAGRRQGRVLAHSPAAERGSCVEATLCLLEDMGFDPASVEEDGLTTVAFGHCPFAELAERNPEVVCSLHRGVLEGFVDEVGGAEVRDFHDLAHRSPCTVCLEPSA
jgi:predicted ArsR family transcriptional regulator